MKLHHKERERNSLSSIIKFFGSKTQEKMNSLMLPLLLLLPLALAHTPDDNKLVIDDLSLPNLATLDALNPPGEYSDRS